MTLIEATLPGAPPASYLRMQFFPATIEGLSGPLPNTDLKVVVTNSHFIVLASGPNSFYVSYAAPLDEYLGFNKTTRKWHLITENGDRISISRADSCGCGSKLRGFSLYPNLRYG